MAVGFNFRDSVAYTTDPAGTIGVGDSGSGDTYPITRDGHDFGWNNTVFGANRSTSVDARFAGYCAPLDATRVSNFQYDVLDGPGTYPIRLALGDYSFGAAVGGRVILRDGVSGPVRLDVSMPALSGDEFADSTGTIYTSSTWDAGAASNDIEISSGVLIIELGDSTATDTSDSKIAHIEIGDAIASGPTVTDVDTDESVYPGQSFVITGTNFGATQGTGGVTIGSVAQTVTGWTDTSITCTAVRGGNSYGTGKTLTVTTDAATTATITVAQEAEPGTFAVTAASPNTTDDASLWTGLIDTATSNPITIVDGDQALAKNPNNLTNLAISGDGTITADETGDFVVQIWLASEGVWGSDQTVTFEIPTPPASTPGSGRRGFLRAAFRDTVNSIIGSIVS